MIAPWVTASQTVDGKNEAANGAIAPKGLDRVLGARGVKPTRIAKVRRKEKLIRPHEPNQQQTGNLGHKREHTTHAMGSQ